MSERSGAVREPGGGGGHLLAEVAGLLDRGRLDGDVGTMARVPRSHAQVSAAVVDFARVADDRGRNLVRLLTSPAAAPGPAGPSGAPAGDGTAALPDHGELGGHGDFGDAGDDAGDPSACAERAARRAEAAHYEDVAFLESCDPRLIERNAAEYERMRELLDHVGPLVRKAASARYGDPDGSHEDRAEDVSRLVRGLRDGYEAARTALSGYAAAVEEAGKKLRDGRDAQDRLSDVISRGAVPLTRTAQDAEPMRRWEDLRASTGRLDRLAELGVDRDAIADEAGRCYEQARAAFGAALLAEQGARSACVAELRRARAHARAGAGASRTAPAETAVALPAQAEALSYESDGAGDSLTRLPGSAPGKGSLPTFGDERVSPLLRDLRGHRERMPDVGSRWLTDALGSRREWIEANKDAIKVAAAAYGLPPDLLAGIAWVEVGGKPYVADDVTQWLRHTAESDWSPLTPGNLPGPLAGDRDNTSFGPMAVQVRRAAETLGYDPAHLTEDQRAELTAALKDPSENLLISAKHLADLKAHSSFACVPAGAMAPEQYRELAARYNGGPYWEGSDAQSYADEFEEHREQAKQALG